MKKYSFIGIALALVSAFAVGFVLSGCGAPQGQEATPGSTILSFLPLIIIFLIIIAIVYFIARKLIHLKVKGNIRMLVKIIGAGGLFIAAYNCRILIRGLQFFDVNITFLSLSFYAAVAGILLIIPLFLKIELKKWIEWIPIVFSILFYILAIGKLFELDFLDSSAITYLFFQLIGYFIAIPVLIVSQKEQKKPPEENSEQIPEEQPEKNSDQIPPQ